MQPANENATIEHITSRKLTKPLRIYSHATIHNGMVYTSAIQGFIPGTFDFPSLDPKIQTQQVLDNLKVLLEEVGSGLDRIVKITIYMTQSKYFPGINDAVNEVFPQSPPARSSITVADLPHDAEVAIEATAVLR